ncbi:MAG: hypothetical protein P1S60_04490 [Anaerolineae bacterium]|nr:hypothetical protein [Anaerolineae bacterium]
MKQKSKGICTVAGTALGIFLVIALFLLIDGGVDSQAQGLLINTEVPLVIYPSDLDTLSQLTAQNDVITCTLEITTTDKSPLDNHSFAQAAGIANYTNQALATGDEGSNSVPQADYYRLDNAIPQTRYTVQAKPDWTTNYNLGIIVYDQNKTPIITDTNTFDNNYATVVLVAQNQGPYYFKVFQVSAQCSGYTYSLILSSASPTATPTPTITTTPQPEEPTPQPTWRTGFDAYEPNYTFEKATTIAPGVPYNLNFIPWGGAAVDNDFFRIRVKPGLQLTCETSNLDPGVDPRMVLYSGPGEGYFIAANDDIELGNFNSRLSYYASFEGYIYILIGQGNRMDTWDTVSSDYTLNCRLGVGIALTPGPGKDPVPTASYPTITPRPTVTPPRDISPIATPVHPEATPTPAPPEPDRTLSFRLISRPDPPTPTPEPSGFRTFRVQIYFDTNVDGQFGAGEGVTGFYVVVLNSGNRDELAQGYTDEQGQLSFTVPTIETVRVLIPLLGIDRLVEVSKPEVTVRIIPPTLPDKVP